MREVVVKGSIQEERVTLGSYEVWRKKGSGALAVERQTLHTMDGLRRIAPVVTLTVDDRSPPEALPTPADAQDPSAVSRERVASIQNGVTWTMVEAADASLDPAATPGDEQNQEVGLAVFALRDGRYAISSATVGRQAFMLRMLQKKTGFSFRGGSGFTKPDSQIRSKTCSAPASPWRTSCARWLWPRSSLMDSR